MNWKFFGGSCILIGGLLVKLGAPLPAVGIGILLAAVVVRRSMTTNSKL